MENISRADLAIDNTVPATIIDLDSGLELLEDSVDVSILHIPYNESELPPRRRKVILRTQRGGTLTMVSTITRPRRDELIPETNERRLRTSVIINNTDRVRALIEAGTDVNCSDAQKRSPLHLAACKGYTDLVRLLLHYGADPNKKDELGNTPLHLAACSNKIDVVTLLLDAGTDIMSLDNHGRSPLQLAQGKLRLIREKYRAGPSEMNGLREQVQQVVSMMISFLEKRKQINTNDTNLDELSDKLNKLRTSDIIDVDTEVTHLLDDLHVLETNSK